MKVATEKVWKTILGDYVEDGHPDAAHLVAIKGQTVKVDDAREGSDRFFHEVNAPQSAPVQQPEPQSEPEPDKPVSNKSKKSV